MCDGALLGGEFTAVGVADGSIQVRRAREDRSFTVRGPAAAARWSAVPQIADAHRGTGCRAGRRLDGADPAYAQRRRPAPYAAKQKSARLLRPTALDTAARSVRQPDQQRQTGRSSDSARGTFLLARSQAAISSQTSAPASLMNLTFALGGTSPPNNSRRTRVRRFGSLRPSIGRAFSTFNAIFMNFP